MGDLNVRTKDFLDYIPHDTLNNVFSVDTDYNTCNFEIPRNNKDNTVHNSYGKCLVELCCVHDIHLLNGRLHDDFSGNFKCTATNGKSV